MFALEYTSTLPRSLSLCMQEEDGGKDNEDGLWDESFKSHTDSKPNGM